MSRFLTLILAGILAVAIAGPQAIAAPVLFQNPVKLANDSGNCTFGTTCTGPSEFGADRFTLGSASTIGAISFSALNFGSPSQVTGVDWRIYSGGSTLPGTLIASGNNASYTLGAPQVGQSYTHSEYVVDIADLAVGAGTYWVAFRAITPNWDTFWSYGVNNYLSAQSNDFGATWVQNYASNPGIGWAFTVYGASTTVPAPGALALLGLGMFGFGAMRRRTR